MTTICWESKKQNKWALSFGAKEQIGPTGRSRVPGGSAHLFFSLIRTSRRFYITYQIMKEIGPIPRMLRFFRPGHPRSESYKKAEDLFLTKIGWAFSFKNRPNIHCSRLIRQTASTINLGSEFGRALVLL